MQNTRVDYSRNDPRTKYFDTWKLGETNYGNYSHYRVAPFSAFI